MKKIGFVFCLFCMISIRISAYDFSAVNDDGVKIYYNITSTTDLTCEVTYIQYHNYTYKSNYKGDISIPSYVKFLGREYSITSIGERAFSNCLELRTINIPHTVKTIGARSFYKCINLASIDFPKNITTIGFQAFYGCNSLTRIDLPTSVQRIEKGAFCHCENLRDAVVHWDVPIQIDRNVFDVNDNGEIDLSLSVPNGFKKGYISAEGWKHFLYIKE